MEKQETVAEFIEQNELDAPPEYRLLDLVSELGEVSKELNESTGYGDSPQETDVSSDEIGDSMFALLALAESLDVDAGKALDEAIEKYNERLDKKDTPSSGS